MATMVHNPAYNKYVMTKSDVDFEILRPNFGFVPISRLRGLTMQYYLASSWLPMHTHY